MSDEYPWWVGFLLAGVGIAVIYGLFSSMNSAMNEIANEFFKGSEGLTFDQFIKKKQIERLKEMNNDPYEEELQKQIRIYEAKKKGKQSTEDVEQRIRDLLK